MHEVPKEPRRGCQSVSWTEVTDVWELPYECLKLNLGPLQKQTEEPPLQSPPPRTYCQALLDVGDIKADEPDLVVQLWKGNKTMATN